MFTAAASGARYLRRSAVSGSARAPATRSQKRAGEIHKRRLFALYAPARVSKIGEEGERQFRERGGCNRILGEEFIRARERAVLGGG